jgi:hypothetical protein
LAKSDSEIKIDKKGFILIDGNKRVVEILTKLIIQQPHR